MNKTERTKKKKYKNNFIVITNQDYIPYEQSYCPSCGGSIDTEFRCMRCGKQYQPTSANSSVTKVSETRVD